RPHRAILIGDWLGSTDHVDDGEPTHAERNVAVDVESLAVRAPMSERGGHLPDAFQVAVVVCGREKPRNAAHQRLPETGEAWTRRVWRARGLTGALHAVRQPEDHTHRAYAT